MKTIVFLHPHFLKPAGASKVVLEFASRLQKHFKVTIVTIKTNPQVISSYPNLNFINLGGPTTGSILFWITFPLFLFRLHQFLNKIPNKIVFAHSLAIYWTLFLPNSVLYFHDLGYPYSDSTAEKNSLPLNYRIISFYTNPIFQLLNHALIKSNNNIIANSQASSQFINHKYNRQIEAIINPGIDVDNYYVSTKKSNYFYTVGRLEKIKQIDIIIQSFALFNNPQYKLKIIGDGIEKDNLIKLAKKLKIHENVEFLGKQTTVQISKIASKAKIGIFNCPNESFGLSILESLASGTPVITINKGGGADFISQGSNGYLSDGTAKSINRLIPKIIKQNLSTNARKSSLKYDWDIKSKELANFLQSL
jgi:glycosyltransferase involved in cell wall biosynthesis